MSGENVLCEIRRLWFVRMFSLDVRGRLTVLWWCKSMNFESLKGHVLKPILIHSFNYLKPVTPFKLTGVKRALNSQYPPTL